MIADLQSRWFINYINKKSILKDITPKINRDYELPYYTYSYADALAKNMNIEITNNPIQYWFEIPDYDFWF